jgi:cell division protein FtsN
MSFVTFDVRRFLFIVIPVLAGGIGPVLGQTPAEAKKASPSAAELTKLATVIKPSAEANKWQQIPWLTDVTEGRRLAKEEKRPLFLWTVFGEPLDEC